MAPDEETRDDPEQVEEEFRSLMEGLRTTLPGVQLATAFLLTVPMYDKYDDLRHSERVAYYIAFATALLASLLLTAPSSHQRVRSGRTVARRHRSDLDVAVRLAIAGSALFAVAITAVAYLVSSVVLGAAWAIAVTVVVAITYLWSWYWIPLVTFQRNR